MSRTNSTFALMAHADNLTTDFPIVHHLVMQSEVLLAKLDESEPWVDPSARLALAVDRIALVSFREHARQFLAWEKKLSAAPSSLTSWTPSRREEFVLATESLQDQAATVSRQIETARGSTANAQVRQIGATLKDSFTRLFNTLENHRHLALEIEADADIEAGRLKKFGSAAAAIAYLSKRPK